MKFAPKINPRPAGIGAGTRETSRKIPLAPTGMNR
jgi:hypothetical protein